jgi:hypothetical protein
MGVPSFEGLVPALIAIGVICGVVGTLVVLGIGWLIFG